MTGLEAKPDEQRQEPDNDEAASNRLGLGDARDGQLRCVASAHEASVSRVRSPRALIGRVVAGLFERRSGTMACRARSCGRRRLRVAVCVKAEPR